MRGIAMRIALGLLLVGGGSAAAVGITGGVSTQDHGSEPAVEVSELPKEAQDGIATAQEKHHAATAYAESVDVWTDCVADAAAARGDDAENNQEPFDLTGTCGERPDPAASGLTDVPEQADDRADPQGPPSDAPTPQDVPSGGDAPPSDVPSGQPSAVPSDRP